MLNNTRPNGAGWLFALLLCIQAPAQATSNANQTGESVFTHVNPQAALSRSDNSAALPIFPTGYAINASSYTEAEALVVSNSITASSSTTITVPTPTTTGFSAVVFADPTTNLVLGAASFENIQRTTTTACTGHVCGVQP